MATPSAVRPVRLHVVYPFHAESPNELSVTPGEVLLAYYQVGGRWLFARRERSRECGYVPFLYCRTESSPLDDNSSLSSLASLSSSASSFLTATQGESKALHDSFDSGVSSQVSSPPPPPVFPRIPATCLKTPTTPRRSDKRVTFSSGEPQVFLTPRYTVTVDEEEDVVNLDEVIRRPNMQLYETVVSDIDENGDIETVTLV